MNDLKLSPAQKAMLEAPLDAGRIAKRKGGGGMTLDYLETWDVIEAANRIFGFDGWSFTTSGVDIVSAEQVEWNGKKNWHVLYKADVKVVALNVAREDVGTCVAQLPNLAEAHEMAMKGSVSDGLKRCLRTFGDQFGNCLYRKDSPGPSPSQAAPNGGKDNSANEAAKNLYAELNINADDFATIKGLTGGRPFAIVKEAHEHGCKNGAQVIAYIESGVIPA